MIVTFTQVDIGRFVKITCPDHNDIRSTCVTSTMSQAICWVNLIINSHVISHNKAIYPVLLWQSDNKVTQLLLIQSGNIFMTGGCCFFISKWADFIRKCSRYKKVRQIYYKVRQVINSMAIITKRDMNCMTLKFKKYVSCFPNCHWVVKGSMKFHRKLSIN